MTKDQAIGLWLAFCIAIFFAVVLTLLTSCTSMTEPAPAEYEVDCNNYFNQCPAVPLEGGDDE